MPNRTSSVPKYRKHKASGQAVVTLNGRDYYLGPHDSQASHIEYDRRIAEWLANERRPAAPDVAQLTIAMVTAEYWSGYVVPRYGNKQGSDQEHNIRAALRPLLKLFEQLPAAKFGPLALQAVRDEMVASGLARTTINDRVKRIRRMFRWLASREFVPESVYRTLKTLDGLRRGETSAREPEPIRPVAPDRVAAATAHLPDVVADMVRLQQLTGMRSGELCIMRPMDIDRSGAVWRYVPESHKTQYRGKRRVVFLGRRAQAILLRYLARHESMYCFRPVDSEAKRRAARHAARKTPLSCGNRPGSNCQPERPRSPGECYTPESYYRAVVRGCDLAFPLPAKLARRKRETLPQWRERLSAKELQLVVAHQKAHRWTPHQLRHALATQIRKQYGIEAAGILLGHAKIDATEVYAQRDEALAVRIVKEVG